MLSVCNNFHFISLTNIIGFISIYIFRLSLCVNINVSAVMDIGPQNVLGKRPSLVEPLVQELIAKIEGRIGTLTVDDRKKRLHLPITTECLVDSSAITHSGRPLRYEFVPDLGKDSFEKVKKRLEILLSGHLTENPPNPLFKINSVRASHTVDEIYKKPVACRVSYDKSTYGMEESQPIEVIAKDNIHKLDVFSGHYPDIDEEATAEEEGQNRHPFDYRFSVNKERVLDPSIVSTLNRSDCQMVRDKQRTSFDMKAWTVDLTRVTVIHPASGSGEKYEVEIELKRELLAEQLDRRAKGKTHGAYQILTDFLFFIRDLAYIFGPSQDSGKAARFFSGGFKYPELVSCEPSEEKKRKYKDVMGTDVMPIIGDYVFQILDEIRPPSNMVIE